MEIKYFSMSELFDIKSGKRLESINQTKGKIPFIGSTDSNNGITNFIGNGITHKAPMISISYNGSVGYSFYQNKDCWFSDDVKGIYLKNYKVNKYIGIYLSSQLSQMRFKYAYGMKLGTKRLQKELIPLPTSDGINPDWDYMEKTVKKLYTTYKKNSVKIKPIENFKPKIKEFSLNQYFKAVKGKSLNKIDTEQGDINFITAQISNNGIESKIKSDNYYQNILTITANGANVGTCFYQTYKCTGNQDMIFISPKDKELNKYIGIYLASQFTQLSKKYTYGMKLNLTRFKKESIPLPCTPSGDIDWEYMENTVKNIIK